MEEETARRILEVQGYAELGLFDEAEAELARLDPDLEAVGVLHCDLLSRQSKWEEMRALAEGFARRSPESSQWWISLAYAVRRAESVEGTLKQPGNCWMRPSGWNPPAGRWRRRMTTSSRCSTPTGKGSRRRADGPWWEGRERRDDCGLAGSPVQLPAILPAIPWKNSVDHRSSSRGSGRNTRTSSAARLKSTRAIRSRRR